MKPIGATITPVDVIEREELINSSKSSLPEDLNLLLDNKTLQLGTNPINLPEKLNWIHSSCVLPNSFQWIEQELTFSQEKDQALQSIESYLKPLNLPSRLISLILTTADELIMNAFFDAPVENGVVLFKNTPRGVNIKSPSPVRLLIGHNGEEIVLSVKDQYGSVNPKSIVKHLKKTFTEDGYVEPTNGTGAGVGLSLCVKRNTSLVIKVNQNVESQFTAFFPIVKSFKDYLEKSQIISLHIQNTNLNK